MKRGLSHDRGMSHNSIVPPCLTTVSLGNEADGPNSIQRFLRRIDALFRAEPFNIALKRHAYSFQQAN